MLNRARPLVAFIAKRRKNVNATPHSVPLGQRTSSNTVQGFGKIIQACILNKEPDASPCTHRVLCILVIFSFYQRQSHLIRFNNYVYSESFLQIRLDQPL